VFITYVPLGAPVVDVPIVPIFLMLWRAWYKLLEKFTDFDSGFNPVDLGGVIMFQNNAV
jgi:hypothetical protein